MGNVMTKPTGRPFCKEARIHKTYWVSEEEHRFISSYLQQRRRKRKQGAPGRNRFAEKVELIRKRQDEERRYERRQAKLARELKELVTIENKE